MLRILAINVGAGYAQKAVQIICGLLTIPILLSENGLGISGYGELAVAISLAAMISTAFDGYRLTAARRIGNEAPKCGQEADLLSTYMLILAAPVVTILIIFQDFIYALAGLNNAKSILIYLISVTFIIDQLTYTTEQYYHSNLKSSITNILNSIEVSTRLIAIFILFRNSTGTIETYFYISIATSTVKLIFLWIIRLNDGFLSINPRLPDLYEFSRESIPLSLYGISLFMAFRLSVIIANRLLSAELAAIFSIVFVTLRNYLNQLFVSVIRPMAIPLMSRLKISDMPEYSKKNILYAVATYELLINLATLLIAATSPYWLAVWLRQDFSGYYGIIALGISALSIELAISLKCMFLISQGKGNSLTRISFFWGSAYLLALAILNTINILSLTSMVIATAFYIILLNGISINLIYLRKYNDNSRSLYSVAVVFVTIIALYLLTSKLQASLPSITFALGIWSISAISLFILNNTAIREIPKIIGEAKRWR